MSPRTVRVTVLLAVALALGLGGLVLVGRVIGPCSDRPGDPTCVGLPGASPASGAGDLPVGPDGGGLPSLEAMPTPNGAPTASPAPSADWSAYSFHDEFDGTSLQPWWGRHWGSLGISHLDRGHSSVADGILTITAQRTPSGWTSDLLDTFGAFRQRYGYFEARIRIPEGRGLWPAFWLADDWASTPAEFDVMEICANPPGTNRGNDVTVLHQIIHGATVYRLGAKSLKTTDLSTDWHTYGVEWRPDHVAFFFDGVETWRYTDASQIPSMPMTVILSLELGTWCGQPDATTPDTAAMQVDWVRVRP